jgi:uncharacterized membrane protein YkoI
MMELNQALQKVKEHEGFLAHAFIMLDDTSLNSWQLGFYHNKKIITFIIQNDTVTSLPPADMLSSGSEVQELLVANVSLTVTQALEKADSEKKEKYAAEVIMKTFCIIQVIDARTVYNVTFFTQSFKTINVKIAADTGEIMHSSCEALVSKL